MNIKELKELIEYLDDNLQIKIAYRSDCGGTLEENIYRMIHEETYVVLASGGVDCE